VLESTIITQFASPRRRKVSAHVAAKMSVWLIVGVRVRVVSTIAIPTAIVIHEVEIVVALLAIVASLIGIAIRTR